MLPALAESIATSRVPTSSSSVSSVATAAAMAADPSVPATNGGGKVKQTRRRQRLSCVECTKRRQKCDRQIPCGLCVSRGIPNLCRWEPIVVRPSPQKPPVVPTETPAPSSASATIQTLTARVAALEKALAEKQRRLANDSELDIRPDVDPPFSPTSALSALSSAATTINSPVSPTSTTILTGGAFTRDDNRNNDGISTTLDNCDVAPATSSSGGDGPRALIDFNVQVAAVALAQLSLAPRTEYIGAGTVLCALHKLGDPESWKFPFPSSASTTRQVPSSTRTSSSSPSLNPVTSSTNPGLLLSGASHPAHSPIRELISHLPPQNEMNDLLDSFFATRNAEYGISEKWFRSAVSKMWHFLDLRCVPDCARRGGCPACQEEVNPHWLALVFSVLAVSPRTARQGALYFNQALLARRLVDDILLASVYSTSEFAVHGGVLSCLAAVFLSSYLADRGRVSEAWKMCGNALRTAQALGLHRDPRWRKWESMGKVESDLRILTWWLLASFDRLYSFILGRPAMAVRGAFEMMPTPPTKHGDGSPNPNAHFQREFIQLSELICDAATKLLSFESPSYPAVVDVDRRFQEYEAHLPLQLKWRAAMAKGMTPRSAPSSPGKTTLPIQERFLCYQRVILAAWYLDALMNIHRPYLMHPPPILPVPGSTSPSRTPNPSREHCIQIAMELTRTLCRFHSECSEWLGSDRMSPNMFSYFLFDGTVALAGALSQVPPHPQASECLDLMDHAMRALEDMANAAEGALDGEGETAKRAIKVLGALRKAGGWGMDEEEKGELVVMMDVQRQQQQPPGSGSGTGVGGLNRPAPSLDTDFYGNGNGNGGSGPSFSSLGQSDTSTGASTTGSGGGGPLTSTYLGPGATPFLNPSSPDHQSQGYFYFGSSTTAPSADMSSSSSSSLPSSTSSSPFPPPSMMSFPDFTSMSMSLSNPGVSTGQSFFFPTNGVGGGNNTNSNPRNAQSVLPYEILQGVQSSSNGRSPGFDLDWVKLAGMETWYSGVAAAFDGSL